MGKGKIKVKVSGKKKPIKPKMGRGTGGVLTARILAVTTKKENNG